jgi:SAM-dependent methyltransferase
MLKTIWRRLLADRTTQSVGARSEGKVVHEFDDAFDARLASEIDRRIAAALDARLGTADVRTILEKPWKANLHIPPIRIHPKLEGPFMVHSTCSTADLLNPEFERLCGLLGLEPEYHRKYWEWVFVLHHALRTGAVGPGRRVLGFAVGAEPLPSAFAAAGAEVTATDAPEEIGVAQGWRRGGAHAAQLLELHNPSVVSRETFLANVKLSTCDMNAIPDDLSGFDFCWSACSFEHLGDLKKGMDFVVASVERTLRPGGIACHTTELNLSSDDDTVDSGPTVLYRKRDISELVNRLEQRGHRVEPFRIAPDTHVLDFFADTPPYHAPPHLKLRLLGYVSTSVGLMITRGGAV